MRRERNRSMVCVTEKRTVDHKRILVLCITAVFFIFGACTLFGNLLISAHGSRTEEPVNFKYFKSIEIQPGDTLWDIAEEYITEDYKSVTEYVMVLKEMNSLSTDDIQAGQNLMIAYNDTEFNSQE